MSMIEVSLIQGSPEWHTWRKTGIGGSDAPVIEGTSPYKTVRQLFLEKAGAVSEDEESNEFIFSKGHRTEEIIRRQFLDLTGVEMKPVCAQHSKFKYITASLDGFDGKLGVLEGKLVGQEALEVARTQGVIPKHHYTQIQHQLEVTGADVGQWFGHDGKKNGIIVPVKFNKEFVKPLLDMEHGFWANLKSGVVPALSDRDYLIPDDLSLLIQLKEMKEMAENASIAYEALREKVITTFKHPRIAGAGVKIFRVIREGAVDWKSVPEVKALEPDYLNKFRRAGSQSYSVIMDKKGLK